MRVVAVPCAEHTLLFLSGGLGLRGCRAFGISILILFLLLRLSKQILLVCVCMCVCLCVCVNMCVRVCVGGEREVTYQFKRLIEVAKQ
jgi:hypothetical protein